MTVAPVRTRTPSAWVRLPAAATPVRSRLPTFTATACSASLLADSSASTSRSAPSSRVSPVNEMLAVNPSREPGCSATNAVSGLPTSAGGTERQPSGSSKAMGTGSTDVTTR